jgi:hypothetical protein
MSFSVEDPFVDTTAVDLIFSIGRMDEIAAEKCQRERL